MMHARTPGIIALGLVVSTHALQGQDRFRYLQLGSDLPTVSALTRVAVSQAKTIHLRPALMQELRWNRGYSVSDATAQPDPVQQIVFSFYNDQLTKLVVDYGWGSTTLTGPLVLGRMGGQVLDVNAVLDEERVVVSEDQTRQHLDVLARLVGCRSSSA